MLSPVLSESFPPFTFLPYFRVWKYISIVWKKLFGTICSMPPNLIAVVGVILLELGWQILGQILDHWDEAGDLKQQC